MGSKRQISIKFNGGQNVFSSGSLTNSNVLFANDARNSSTALSKLQLVPTPRTPKKAGETCDNRVCLIE